MTPIRLVSVFGCMLIASASASAHAASPAAVPVPAGVESALPKLELGLAQVDYVVEDRQAQRAPRPFRTDERTGSRTPSLAQYLNAPAPYGQFLPRAIEGRGVGYRVWF